MIKKQTVLVLGAGASMHLEYPSGKSLKEEILNEALVETGRHYSKLKESLPSSMDTAIIPEIINRFHDLLRMSGRQSIDDFLTNNPKYTRVGTVAIAVVISAHEDQEKLFANKDGDWYQYLYNAMDSPGTTLQSFRENQLAIITFNYDRSLEEYLFHTLESNHQDETGGITVIDAIKSIPIIHVHGQIGELPWLSSQGLGRPYGENDLLRTAASGIKVIDDVKIDNFAPAWKEIEKSQRIIFLGFGYNETNIKHLMQNFHEQRGRLLRGTCFGMTGQEMDDVKGIFTPIAIELGNPSYKIFDFLMNEVSL